MTLSYVCAKAFFYLEEKKMQSKKDIEIGRFISFILRHHPESVGITLDEHGWTDTDILTEKVAEKFKGFSFADLERIVRENNKQRYSFNEDKTRIRANQGHSVSVNMEFTPVTPPDVLYHGTGEKSVDSILANGIQKMSRQYVHLSADCDTAVNVGKRHGKPVVLQIAANEMSRDGYKFYLSENKVWLTDFVPTKYIEVINNDRNKRQI